MGHNADTLSIKLKATWGQVLLAQISNSERADKQDEQDKMSKMSKMPGSDRQCLPTLLLPNTG